MNSDNELIVSANIYEYKSDDTKCSKRASLLVISYHDDSTKIALAIIDNKVEKVEIQQDEKTNASVIGLVLNFIKERDFTQQIYKNSNAMDINTKSGIEKAMDIIRIGTSKNDTALEILNIIRNKKYVVVTPHVFSSSYATWGDWA